MIFIPRYTVSYKGVLRASGKPFEIDDKDKSEMSKHGTIVAEKCGLDGKSNTNQAQSPKKSGRPKKNDPKEVSQNANTGSPEKKD